MAILKRLLRALPLLLASPFLLIFAVIAIAAVDLAFAVAGRRKASRDSRPSTRGASVVIPNWNGRDLLQKYLPSIVTALAGNAENEIIVVDNGSTDGSADYIREHHPEVTLVALESNRGFGGGSNAGFEAARNDIVVLLNSDMRVAPDFLAPLIAGFTDEKVFAVSCQIFFTDPERVREETGLTQGWWENGSLRVRHRADAAITGLFPCFYGGGGSCAFDRNKFLELGGFDELLSPFYLEDTDLGYLAWKRGWKVLYQPNSIVYHEHRGTIGKRFTDAQIQAVLKKNYLLFVWKNIHDWRRLSSHFSHTFAGAVFSAMFGDAPGRPSLAGLWRAFLQLPGVARSRTRARSLAAISDDEAFRRPLGGHFRDTFGELPVQPERLSVLFVSPYPFYPPVHGGGVFMYQTVRELARLCDLHLIVLLDYAHELEPHQPIRSICKSVEFIVRMDGREKALGAIEPHAVREFRKPELHWLIHRQILLHRVDVLQLEYTVMVQYAGRFQRIPSIVFEHDVYFQSIARGLPFARSLQKRIEARWEYLRALHYELKQLPHADRIQVCSRENREVLESYLPGMKGRIDDSFRAGIDTSSYSFRTAGREPNTMLFLGSFRHVPNQEALDWLMKHVLPRVCAERPAARLVIAGSDPPPKYSLPPSVQSAVDMLGFVEDVREPLSRYALFLCPILSGSGVRVKLLEAFASGIPVVSTRLGAEGLASVDGEICALADDPEGFADRIMHLLDHPEQGSEMAARAREYVERERDMVRLTEKLVDNYRATLAEMRAPRQPEAAQSAYAAPISPSDPSSTGA